MKVLFTILLFVVAVAFALGQERAKARLIDEMGKACSEDFSARYDSFFSQLKEDPNSVGYILFNGDKNAEGLNLYYQDALSDWYPQTHRLDRSRIVFIRGQDQEGMAVKFWLAPPGADPPTSNGEYSKPSYTQTALFDKSWADFNRDELGRLRIHSFSFAESWGCDFPPNFGSFAKTLLENPNLTGYLITYTVFGRGRTRGYRVGQFAINGLVRDQKVPRKRLKSVYGGNRKEPEIELWLVPKRGRPPVATPEKRPRSN